MAADTIMSDLYESDILEWSDQQASLLRRLAAGERVNDQVDWDNVAEEIESVGRSERNAVESHLVMALLHDLKAEAWPLSRDVEHWRAEARRLGCDYVIEDREPKPVAPAGKR